MKRRGRLSAHIIAAPVLDWLDHFRGGRVLGSSQSILYVDAGGFVVAVSARSVPLMPNCISVAQDRLAPIPSGELSEFHTLRIGPDVVGLGDALRWEPRVTPCREYSTYELSLRGVEILRACGVHPVEPVAERLVASMASSGLRVARDQHGREGLIVLLRALVERDAQQASSAADRLLGWGSGLTPEGDDILAASMAVLTAQWDGRGNLINALYHPEAAQKTTALSATLLALARRGRVAEPLGQLLDLTKPSSRWRPALRRLLRVGHSTGRTWAMACGAVAFMLGTNDLQNHLSNARRSREIT